MSITEICAAMASWGAQPSVSVSRQSFDTERVVACRMHQDPRERLQGDVSEDVVRWRSSANNEIAPLDVRFHRKEIYERYSDPADNNGISSYECWLQGCSSAGDVDKDISDQKGLASIHHSALIGLYLTKVGALEEAVTMGAELAARSQRNNILFSEMDLSRFGVPDLEGLELLEGMKLQAGSLSETEAAPALNFGECTVTCCDNQFILYKYSHPVVYTRWDNGCSWTPIGSTNLCTCAF